jgi:uncharacterized protein (DUF3084 family)
MKMANEDMERTMQFILEQQAQFMANIQILQEQRKRDDERLLRLERAFVQLTELAVSANERMNEHDARMNEHDESINEHHERLARVEEAVVLLTRLVGGKDGE